jgi:DNA (cytosine-5)-methyltransferase 1
LGADFEHYRVCEFDKYAIKSYNAIHGTDFATSDITQLTADDLGIVDTDKYCYIMTYSFPCQDLSVAGKQAGMTKGSGTRSGLLWEVERLLNEVENLPKVLLMENVPQVHGQGNMADFQKWIDFLASKGYSNYWQDLNAKNYGVAQNRDRCFMVSILGEWNYKFPKPIELTKRMKDYLEDEVDEKYYINNEKAQKLIDTLISNGTIPSRAEQTCIDLTINEPREIGVANCISARTDRGISNRSAEGSGVVQLQ